MVAKQDFSVYFVLLFFVPNMLRTTMYFFLERILLVIYIYIYTCIFFLTFYIFVFGVQFDSPRLSGPPSSSYVSCSTTEMCVYMYVYIYMKMKNKLSIYSCTRYLP